MELITNPSARFDPDGTAGILNIVLKKNRLEGISGQIQATYGTGDNHDANASLNYRTPSVSLSSNVGWNDRWMFMAGETDRTQFWPGDSTSESFVSRPGDSHRGSLSGSLKAEWRVAPSWTMFGGFNQNVGIRDSWDTTRTAESWRLANGENLYATDALRTQEGVGDSKGGDIFWGFERPSEHLATNGRRTCESPRACGSETTPFWTQALSSGARWMQWRRSTTKRTTTSDGWRKPISNGLGATKARLRPA